MQGAIRVPTTAHRAAITGKVIDAETRVAVAGVSVTIVGMPSDFERWIERWLAAGTSAARRRGRPDQTETARDGCFCFVDLPAGDYTVSFVLPKATRRYGRAERAFHVAAGAEGGETAVASAEIELPPTGVRGRVVGGGEVHAPVSLARVRAEGSGEVAYCDAQGRFYLTGVEQGARRVRISASGFDALVTTVTVAEGVIFDAGDIMLNVASG